ncbi:UL49.5 envelope/tegument protein [Meleagrid alphaherpesvirus 1]|uniref:UL49.5 envelope/tegument protein n=1 Tax=Meleagrid herpesvirus 1 TaxID=37108 RepID=Q9DH60_MEHV1|nr:envelope glycoprotein N [Meleagrid alphaherpesvirus 1]AKQ48648.1 envelope glycoprotein N [iBAC vector pMeHV1-C7]AKQ48720.1 envelope glycoprotein N [iBAC vector pMeHV1-C9]AKQ48792.1 envelope glycoprotein N [iBAC vector pMeHV1-C10]AKQ48864.1 envelope glycoprotein N [iBAC vector pMeHV1-C17]AKQ48936.1 envelope glycoprotein N [iBAC vector pMeHV1-C18]
MGSVGVHHISPSWSVYVIWIVCVHVVLAVDGERSIAGADFWDSTCSAVGVSIAFSSGFSVLFYLGLAAAISALLVGSYSACFRLFTADMFREEW